MSEAAVDGVRVLVADVRELLAALEERDWAAPSGCPGWRVQDVVAHLSGFFTMLVDPAGAKPLTPADVAEAVNDVHDVLAPSGPVHRPHPPLDAARLGPTLDWMLRGLPAMSDPGLAGALERPVELELTGPGTRRVLLRREPDSPNGVAVTAAGSQPTIHRARSKGIDFVSWATRRSPWRDAVTLTGDQDRLARVLDLVRVI
jgi:hypothetical protein